MILFLAVVVSFFVTTTAYVQELPRPHCITFDHSPLADEFRVNDDFPFSRADVTFEPFEWSNRTVYQGGSASIISDASRLVYRGSGNGLSTNNINLYFVFPQDTQSIRLLYGSWGGNLNIGINDQRKNIEGRSLLSLDSMTIGDALVTVPDETCDISGCLGEIVITGPSISKFLIGGQEFFVDDICIDAPLNGVNELPPPVHRVSDPPQEEGVDLPNVEVAGLGNITSVLVENRSSRPIKYTPGDWLEPKYGSIQRVMIVRETLIESGEIKEVDVACMQKERDEPDYGIRFFSQTKQTEGVVQMCQRRCVSDPKQSEQVQDCIWGCGNA